MLRSFARCRPPCPVRTKFALASSHKSQPISQQSCIHWTRSSPPPPHNCKLPGQHKHNHNDDNEITRTQKMSALPNFLLVLTPDFGLLELSVVQILLLLCCPFRLLSKPGPPALRTPVAADEAIPGCQRISARHAAPLRSFKWPSGSPSASAHACADPGSHRPSPLEKKRQSKRAADY